LAFCERTREDLADVIDAAYEGSTKKRFAKFMRSAPMKTLKNVKLIDTTANQILDALTHGRAGTPLSNRCSQ
jgi:hypothetical protein